MSNGMVTECEEAPSRPRVVHTFASLINIVVSLVSAQFPNVHHHQAQCLVLTMQLSLATAARLELMCGMRTNIMRLMPEATQRICPWHRLQVEEEKEQEEEQEKGEGGGMALVRVAVGPRHRIRLQELGTHRHPHPRRHLLHL